MYNNLYEKYQKIEDNLNSVENKNDFLREDMCKYETQVNAFHEIKEKYEVMIKIIIQKVIFFVQGIKNFTKPL